MNLVPITKPVERVQPAAREYTWHSSGGVTTRTARPFLTRQLSILGHVVDVWYERVDAMHIGWRAILLDGNEAMIILSIRHNGALSSSAISTKARRRQPWKSLQAYMFANCHIMTFRVPE